MLVYFECDLGCGIRKFRSIRLAEREITKEVGTINNLTCVRKATKDDIAWVGSMGGHIPETARG
jgi:hypothetical protein